MENQNLDAGLELKKQGMQAAARNKKEELFLAREIAVRIALADPNRLCHADLVQEELIPMGIHLGNAAGSLFLRGNWEFTGEWVRSTRVSNHASFRRIWRLK